MSSTNWRVMVSPRPVPFCAAGSPSCTKGWNRRFWSSGLMPMPVSSTSISKCCLSSCRRPSRMVTPPWPVNLTALAVRLIRIWRSLASSPLMWRGKAEDWSSSSRRPFSSARSRIISATSRTMAPRSNGADSSCSLPASILAISSTSLMSASRCSPLRLMISSLSCSPAVRSGSRRMRLEKPRMAFKGVRSSWLILARNTLLALLAASAASRAMSSSDVRCWTVSSS